MRLIVLLVAMLLGIAACNDTPKPTAPAPPVVQQSPVATNPWFDATKRLHSQVCLVTPNGMDIRQSAYLKSEDGQGNLVVARVRDYSEREQGLPDEQWLVHFSTQTGEGRLLEVPQGIFPERFVVSGDRSQVCLGGLRQAGDGAFNGPASLVFWGAVDLEPQVIDLSGPVVVQRYSTEGTVICLEIPAAGLSAGLLAPAIDWGSALQEVVLPGLSPSGRPPSWQIGPGMKCMARQRITFDPAQPAAATVQVELKTVAKLPEILRHSFAYHVSYAPFQWEPSSSWADETTLVVKEFLPNPTGKHSRANYHGVFRLVAYNSQTMRRTLVADQVEANIGFVAADGLVFYSLRRPANKGSRWEVWVASTDGLSKRLVWGVADARYVSVVDYSADGRLLIERQYFDEENGRPGLHSELREISKSTLSRNPGAIAPKQVAERIIQGIAETKGEPSLAVPPLISVPGDSEGS